MAIYEYEREDGTRFEIEQRMTEHALKVCPTTGQKVTRLISATAFHLKGSGWYKTDYANGSKSSSSASGASTSDTSTSTGSGSDSSTASAASGDSKSGDSKTANSDSSKSSTADSSSSTVKSS